jgi:hypothetical protein
MQSNRWRSVLAGTCVALGTLALVLSVLLGYATRSVFNSEVFANHVAASLEQPGVSEYVAGRIADAVTAAKPDLIGLRPLIVGGSRSVVSSAPFRAATRRAALEAHRALMSGTAEKLILSVHDVGEILKATLALHPDAAAKIPSRLSARLAGLDDLPAGELADRLVHLARRARRSVLLPRHAIRTSGFWPPVCGRPSSVGCGPGRWGSAWSASSWHRPRPRCSSARRSSGTFAPSGTG